MRAVDAIDHQDVTDRAKAGGWTLPDGWTVEADLTRDDQITDPGKEFDCYSERQIQAWRDDDWSFGIVFVYVCDATGRDWGSDVLGGVEFGEMPDDDGEVTDIQPLKDAPGEYSVIREHDMIGNALRDAVSNLAAFGTPIISEPQGDTVTGL